MERLNEDQNTEKPEEKIRQLLLEKVRDLCRKHGIESVEAEEGEGESLNFIIDPPEDHKNEHGEKRGKSFLNESVQTQFTQKSLMPFVREFSKEYGDYFDFEFLESGEKFAFKISRKKF